MSDTPVDVTALAEEIHKIQHAMRSAQRKILFSLVCHPRVLESGIQSCIPLGWIPATTRGNDNLQKYSTIGQINTACDRLKAISAQLKK